MAVVIHPNEVTQGLLVYRCNNVEGLVMAMFAAPKVDPATAGCSICGDNSMLDTNLGGIHEKTPCVRLIRPKTP